MGNIVAWSFRQRHLCACTLYVTSIYHVPYTLKELSVSVAAQISTCVVHYITVGAFRGGSVLAEVSGWTGMKRSEFEAVQVFKWFTKRSSSPPSPAVARIIFSAASRNCKCIFWQCTFLICIFQRRVCQSEMNTAGVTHLLKARAKRMPGTVGPLDRDQSGSKLQGWQRGSQYHGCLWLLRFCIIKHEHQMMRGSYCISKNYQDLGKRAGAKALWGGKE